MIVKKIIDAVTWYKVTIVINKIVDVLSQNYEITKLKHGNYVF